MSDSVELARRIELLERELPKRPEVSFSGHYARACTGAAQSIPNITVTIIDFGTVTRDPRSLVTTGANWRFTAKVAGDYEASAFILWTTTTAWALGEVAQVYIYKNGAEYSIIGRDSNMAATNNYKSSEGLPDIVQLAIGDYIDFRVYQSSGGALALFNNANYVHCAIKRLI